MSILDDDAMPDGQKSDDDELTPTFVIPLALGLSEGLSDVADAEGEAGKAFRTSLKHLRSAIYYDLGVLVPPCHVSGRLPLEENGYVIAVSEVPVSYGKMSPDEFYVNDSPESIKVFGLEGKRVEKPRDLMPGAFITAKDKGAAVKAGFSPMGYEEFLIHHLSKIITKYAHTFIGIEETSRYLDFVASGMPRLVEEVTPQIVSIHVVTEVLQRLVQENISIRDLRAIMNALAEWGRVEKDPVMLTEYVRTSLQRRIAFQYTGGRDTLAVYLLDAEIEDVIRAAIRRTQAGSFLSLDPAITEEILNAVRREIGTPPRTAQKPVLITDLELRRFVWKMVTIEFPQLAVISYQELPPELNVLPVARISLRPDAGAQEGDEGADNVMMLESQRKLQA